MSRGLISSVVSNFDDAPERHCITSIVYHVSLRVCTHDDVLGFIYWNDWL